jgi:small multidrug resistance pump
MHYVYLTIAIAAEVIGTSALKATAGFTKIVPSIVVVAGYGVAFVFLSLVVDKLPVGVTYAIWAGMGIVLVAIAGAVLYRQVPDLPAIIGMAMIVAGVVVINVFSKTVTH